MVERLLRMLVWLVISSVGPAEQFQDERVLLSKFISSFCYLFRCGEGRNNPTRPRLTLLIVLPLSESNRDE
jgi:hypothetical protein